MQLSLPSCNRRLGTFISSLFMMQSYHFFLIPRETSSAPKGISVKSWADLLSALFINIYGATLLTSANPRHSFTSITLLVLFPTIVYIIVFGVLLHLVFD